MRVDIATLDADIRLAKAKLQDLGKAANAAARQSVTTGAPADRAAADAASRAYTNQEAAVAGLTRQKRSLIATTNESTAAVRREGFAYREAAKYMLEFGKEAGITNLSVKGLKLGLGGFLAVEAIKRVTEAITGALDKLNELKAAAQSGGGAGGGDPAFLKALQTGMSREVGAQAGEAWGKTAYDAFAKARDTAIEQAASRGGQGGVSILRGGGRGPASGAPSGGPGTLQDYLTTMRGGRAPQSLDWSDPLYTMGTDKIKDQKEQRKKTAQDILDITKNDKSAQAQMLQNIATQKVYNLNFSQMKATLEAMASGKFEIKPIPPESLRAQDTFNNAATTAKEKVDEVNLSVATTAVNIAAATAKTWDWQRALAGLAATGGEMRGPEGARQPSSGSSAGAALPSSSDGGPGFFSDLLSSMGLQVNQNALDALLLRKGPIADLLGTGQAAGGYIRGAGSGTSDSIMARLSNGEYVVNAASVRALGVGYLDSLNSRRFAAGGLVSAASSSGRPVHLHLGSSSFALSGSSGVVDALVSHAHAQQIRSAGVKPSWFAGRPSGA
jgi:hypothetical protein